ncbi:MAG: GNAT family N-acetyltransferase [Johnsonella sp.]|nr:GNAT family N-acetyltransferase [Johnsonella sp.]
MNVFKNIEKMVFFPVLIITLFVAVSLVFFKELAHPVIDFLFALCTQKFGWMYYIACIACFVFLIWITVNPFGNKVLGEEGEKPQYGNFSWIAMLFTAGVGTSIVILGFLEPIYYVSSPPFHLEAFSREAYEYAHMYGQFHWGLSAWAFYMPATVAVGYGIFVKKRDKLNLSTACTELIRKESIKKGMGMLIDGLVVFGIIGSIATSLGIGTPVLSIIIRYVFSLSERWELPVNILILIIWVCIFGGSVYLGLDKGIQRLSNFNIIIAVVFMIFVMLCGDMTGSFKMEMNSIGLYLSQFIRLNTWMDPFGDGMFVENWTVFYWGWWLAFMPMMGIFVARISRGRTIKTVVWGQLIYGSMGCALSFMAFGSYSLYIQKRGILDVSSVLLKEGQARAIIEILKTLPFSRFTMIFLCVLCFIYLATTIDSCAFVIASSTTKKIRFDEEPERWNRILWALIFCFLSIGLCMANEFKAVQLISIIAGFPLIAVVFLLILVCRKMSREDAALQVGEREEQESAFSFLSEKDAQEILRLRRSIRAKMDEQSCFAKSSESEIEDAIKNGFAIGYREGKNLEACLICRLDRGEYARALGLDEEEEKKAADFEDVFVSPGFRGRGLQRKLMNRMEQRALERGKKIILATVAENNIFSYRNFIQSGYRVEKKCKMYGGLERCLMRKDIGEE